MAAMRTLTLAAGLALLTAAKHAPQPPAAPEVPTTVAPTVRAGVEKWRAGDYAGAVAIWQPFAQAGDADALFNMGQAYKLGRGVTADAATARDYYRKAALKGHLPAQANLGIALFQAGEKPEAVKWLKTAADRGEARAQYVLGIAAYNGDGLPRSQSMGYGYLLRAQASGLPQAVTALAGIAPALSPADRTAGEAVAASLAAGTGGPSSLVAATLPRSTATVAATPAPPAGTRSAGTSTTTTTTIPASAMAVPPKTTPLATSAPPAAAPATGTASPVATTARPTGLAMTAVSAASRPAAAPPVATPPRPTATPLPQPIPAQADAAAGAPPHPAVATVDVPPSRSVDALAPEAAKPARAAAPAPTRTTAHEPPLKPFETLDTPARKADGWRVQLGAFSSRKLADAAWAGVREAAGTARPIFAADGAVTKLQMGPFPTRDAAKAACTKLTAAGRACFVTQG